WFKNSVAATNSKTRYRNFRCVCKHQTVSCVEVLRVLDDVLLQTQAAYAPSKPSTAPAQTSVPDTQPSAHRLSKPFMTVSDLENSIHSDVDETEDDDQQDMHTDHDLSPLLYGAKGQGQ
ncbi:hypothetical protein BG011_003324, partial [Mortierella polycephala]